MVKKLEHKFAFYKNHTFSLLLTLKNPINAFVLNFRELKTYVETNAEILQVIKLGHQ